MYIDEATEREAMLLGRDPATIKDKDMLKKYNRLRDESMQDE